jgi:hypothetical protein
MNTAPVSADRWSRALDRARSEGIRLLRGDANAYRVVSGDHIYATTADTCTCAAALSGDPCCKHRAAVRSAEALRKTSRTFGCPTCAGSGWEYIAPETVRCERCDGTGSIPALRLVAVNDPDPDPSGPASGDALEQASTDRARAWRDLERYSTRIDRGDVLTDREWLAFELAQERERDASTRIAALTAGKVAA